MRQNQNRAFWTSAILHLVVLTVVFLATLVELFVLKEQPHVFEMVSESVAEANEQSSALTEPVDDLSLPEVRPLEIPEYVAPNPPESLRKPLEPVAATVQPKTEEKLISIEDFRRKNPQSEKKLTSRPSSPRIKIPIINTEKFGVNLQSSLTTVDTSASSTLTSVERTALQRYGDKLNRQLNRAWIKPENLSGINLVTTGVFDVSRFGSISQVRLSPGSGSRSFDNSVKAAFASVGSFGAPPTGQRHTFTMSFKMTN